MAKAYYIVQWALYESADTRKTENMSWYKKRTKLIGLGIGKVMRQPFPQNMQLFGLWTVLETLATQSSPQHRGWLVRDGVPLDFDGMSSLIPTVPADAFKNACEWFAENIPGWFMLAEFTDGKPPTGKPSGQHPGIVPPTGKPSGQHPGIVPPTGKPSGQHPPRERERENSEKENPERESGSPGCPPDGKRIPIEEEVRAWARLEDIDEEYAIGRFHATTEKNGWEANGQVVDWRSRFKRFWTEDKEKWFSQKKTRRAAARPDAWKKGDQDWWWSSSLQEVEAALSGALLGGEKKTAARLKKILEVRKAK